MGRSNSADLRVEIYRDIEARERCSAAAYRFGIAPGTAVRPAQRKTETGSLAPALYGRPAGGARLAPHIAVLIGWVEADWCSPNLPARCPCGPPRLRECRNVAPRPGASAYPRPEPGGICQFPSRRCRCQRISVDGATPNRTAPARQLILSSIADKRRERKSIGKG